MKRASIKRRTPVKRVNRKRKDAAFVRCYCSHERVEWVQRQPCVVCLLEGDRTQESPSENAHAGGNDGMSRKGPFAEIIPACRHDHDRLDGRALPPLPARVLSRLPELARHTQRQWVDFSSRGSEFPI